VGRPCERATVRGSERPATPPCLRAGSGGNLVVMATSIRKTKPRKLFSIRISPEEQDRARRVADYLGLSVGALLRSLMLEKERDLGIAPPTRPAHKRSRA
jgi:hypothetical protein